jgi:hypothetical protein
MRVSCSGVVDMSNNFDDTSSIPGYDEVDEEFSG